MTQLAPRSPGSVLIERSRTPLPWWTALGSAVVFVGSFVALTVVGGAGSGLLVLVVLAGLVMVTSGLVAVVKDAGRRRLAEQRAWLLAAPSLPEGDRDEVAMELWWTGRGAGVVWDGADVGQWKPDFHSDDAPARLTGALAPSEPVEQASIHRAGLLADRDYLVVGPWRYLLAGNTLVDGLGRTWPLPRDVLGSAGDHRTLVLPRDLGPHAGVLVADRLARRAIAAASAGG